MALSTVNVGTTANDGTGDPLRTAFQTVNTAITAVNNAVVVGTGVTTFKDDSGSAGVSVLSSGFVGVGHSTPATLLHLGARGTGVVGPSQTLSDYQVVLEGGGNTNGYFEGGLAFSDDGANATAAISPVDAGTGGATSWAFSTGGSSSLTERLRITSGGDLSFYNAGSTVGATWDASANSNAGAMGFGTSTPTAQVDLSGDTIRVRTSKTPASAAAAGNAGDICWDASYIYVCTATNTWKRSAIATW